jgi:hypothetical protein
MKPVSSLRRAALCAALLSAWFPEHAAGQDQPLPRPQAVSTGCETSLRAFRRSLERTEKQLDGTGTDVEVRRRAILAGALEGSDLAVVVRCLAGSSAGK